MVRLIAHGWVFSFFWTAAAICISGCADDVDGTPWTEIERPLPTPAQPSLTHSPTHWPLTKSPSKTVLITGHSDSRSRA